MGAQRSRWPQRIPVERHSRPRHLLGVASRPYRNLGRAFGKALRAQRIAAGISQEDLAAQCGLHRTYVSMLERAVNVPSLRTIALLAEALKVRPHELVKAAEELLA